MEKETDKDLGFMPLQMILELIKKNPDIVSFNFILDEDVRKMAEEMKTTHILPDDEKADE
jgi:hypothetical protein